jgi:RNA polymerase sigma-70 factor (ECF subfamily)
LADPSRKTAGTSLVVAKPLTQEKAHAGPSDAALVVAARAGEKWAQEALFRRHARMVNGLAYRLLGRDQELDDLVQTAFMAAFRDLGRLAEPQAFGSWLASIVVRTTHKLLRRRKMLTRLGLREPAHVELDTLLGASLPGTVQRELREIYGVLDALPSEARIALVLHRVDGLSIPEIAERMTLSQSTVKRRLRLAEGEVGKHRQRAEEESTS